MLKVGIIGAGLYGLNHFTAFAQRAKYLGDIKLVGFAEVDAQRRAAMEKQYAVPAYADYRELIEREHPDALTVVTPDHLHYNIVMDCLERRIPVLVEKPLSTSLEEAKAMAKAADTYETLLQVDFHKRFDPYHIDLKFRIQEGTLGKIQYGYCWMEDVLRVGTDMIGKKSWNNQGSPGWFLAIHMIDLSYWLMDCPKPVSVSAFGFKGKLKSMGIDIYDSMKIQVAYDNGTAITYDTTVVLPNSHESVVRQGVKMVGTEGFMEVNSQYRGARGCSTNTGMETPNLGMTFRDYDKDGNLIKKGYFADSIYDFVENLKYLQNGHSLAELKGKYASGWQGVDSVKVGVAMHESAMKNGITIDISNW
ncbi:MAG: Gfo/Idh/MocA family oxidoreductase [Sphaerochaetaceae bacterium]|jgi:predicted dehydrogenase|nr:Gfo/Idh/MocA family oxidoreductase [Sphaerochaetaceae bacterium]NLO61531.1 Gfo/Idh/MocA family oxidoreductase [Spirochaetales bacterium]MDD2407132.1 Gfo/Idh/MocA family oxidoreductase [Sphaerochaetaceae bacterium]MDD3671829.1 Gfo/Idh/MocA family oxidoreductase [Sphaerochaetaceae bacterium]MDD4259696.1 Gfo/Idh/MocA family oxidoreductase [Sphaerochaetaceae bacterium]